MAAAPATMGHAIEVPESGHSLQDTSSSEASLAAE